MDTRFSCAIHVLILISESRPGMTSGQLAESVGTNASYVRKVLALLKNAGIVEGHKGIGGYALRVAPERLTLLQIYQAVTESDDIHILDVHQNPSDRCLVGRHIRPVLTDMFAEMERAFARSLSENTLADCIAAIREKIT